MRLNRAVAAITAAVAIPAAVMVSWCAVTHHGAVAVTHSAVHAAGLHPASVRSGGIDLTSKTSPAPRSSPAADPSLAWLESAGGQAQVTFNEDVDVLAQDLETESHAPTVADHLVFEAGARVVRTEARKILSARALLPATHRAAYVRMLSDFIAVADLLQPGPDYGTTAQDDAAWYKALHASDIDVS
jgi:hypothetical protein